MKKSEAAITCGAKANRFPQFKCIELEDRKLLTGFAHKYGLTSCEYSFANLYSWQDVHQRSWSVYQEHLLILDISNDDLFFPAGREMHPENLAALSKELQNHGMSGNVTMVPEAYIQHYPDLKTYYRIADQRDAADYIYDVEKLAALQGRKLQKKKNLIAQFKRTYPDYRVVPLSGDIRTACWKLAQDLLARNLQISRSIREEHTAMGRALAEFEDIGFGGLALLVADTPVAFSVFSPLNRDMYDIHFEKADPTCKGAAQVINHATAVHLTPLCRYLNREQDLGIAGLRQAKRSYDPARIEVPYKLTLLP